MTKGTHPEGRIASTGLSRFGTRNDFDFAMGRSEKNKPGTVSGATEESGRAADGAPDRRDMPWPGPCGAGHDTRLIIAADSNCSG
jgi:hypothetical protein